MSLDEQTVTTNQMTIKNRPSRTIDVASLILLLIGIFSFILAYMLIQNDDADALLLVPAVVATTTGALNITTIKAPRSTESGHH